MKNGWRRRSLAWLLACGMGVVGGLALAQSPTHPPAPEKAAGGAAPAKAGLIGPQPAWVTPVSVPVEAQGVAQEMRQGVHYLLSDAQVRVDGQQRQFYRHFAMKALNEKGVESIANVELRFDPAYERLVLHAVSVIRGGRRIERLPGLELRVIQREKDLDYLIFDGSKSVHAFLDDVRVGDVVEYAYTVSGSNPVFGDRFFGAFDLQWGSPVGRVHARLLWPAGRPLHIKSLNGAPEVVQRRVEGQEEYVWHRQGQGGLQPSPDAPGWYDPYAQVQWGDFGSWADVARWAVPLYRVPEGLSPALQAEVQRIAALGPDPKLRTAEALRLVQREVRYLGVEAGAGSHAPNAPNLVFKRRFGDCKDKTVLTLALLKALGVKAQAALVHTQQRRTLARQLPRPSVFNHVIVRADIGGRAYWLDPTRATQAGPLDSLGQPDFERALLVDPASTDLTTVEPGAAMLHKRWVAMRIDASAGLSEPARMTVTTTLEGVSAEQMRASLAADTSAELQKRYLNYYARSYPGIAVAQPMEVQDGAPQAGRLTVVEHYQVKNFFARAAGHPRVEASLEVPEVLGQLQAPREAIRNAPLALTHPQELQHELEVLLPEHWDIRDEQEEIKDVAFSLRRTVQGAGRRLLIRDDFRSLAGHVEPQDAATYAADIEKARKLVGYVIYKGDPTSASATAPEAAQGQLNLPVLLLALVMLAVFVKLAVGWHRWDPAPAPTLNGYTEPGLGGPLLLMALGILVNGFLIVQNGLEVLPAYGQGVWNQLTVVGGARYHPAMAPLLLVELLGLLAQAVGWVLLATVFFRRRSSAVRIWLVFMWASAIFSLLDHLAITLVPVLADVAAKGGLAKAIRGLVIVGLWTWYLLTSERVKKTFVCRYREGQAAEPGEEGGAPAPAAPSDGASRAGAAEMAPPNADVSASPLA
ncbi:DUF3857 domain-containing protein [Pelomonas sp. APW6]|uniref:DUF3857 domain-containing protein n=1 Tax=Roseateles subflavus TaxID=3053353 RepID=A0ABT7LQC4_9BURK|nr:DUF3857 domain-containing protein [Pelomonas sp. APW6]MDL5033930.1 DUF3857 domain-containing protein [Pelomonas sp. APW6]